MAELNTLLRVSKGTTYKDYEVGKIYTVTAPRERFFPLHIAILMIDENWQFFGYCVVHSSEIKNQQTVLSFEVLSLFTPEERDIYTKRFAEVAKKTGELK
ncbi:MAG: hypothetical protein NT149_01860 [Candidatus Gottesmanbacteria bacterium]|nr:hypothetical protein [Candidatus Gottesmanbacteria bacterium]